MTDDYDDDNTSENGCLSPTPRNQFINSLCKRKETTARLAKEETRTSLN